MAVEYLADGRLTVADLKVCLMLRHLTSGVLDDINPTLAGRVAPKLGAHRNRVLANPAVKAYYANRS